MTPTHGWTRLGHAVHGKTVDHLPSNSLYQRLNKRVALATTNKVGTMTCAWVFCLLALVSLPATLAAFSLFAHVFPATLVNPHLIALVAWVAQTFIQLVLLSVIMVGQNIQNAATDARAAKTFEDVEEVKTAVLAALDSLDTSTEGGLKTVLDAVIAKTT